MEMKTTILRSTLLTFSLIGFGFSGFANSEPQGPKGIPASNNECPVGLVTGKELDEEFGPGTEALTECLERRHNVKLVMQINRYCRDNVPNADCADGRAYGLAQLGSMIKNYEITHGMVPGRDYELVAVVHDSGGFQMLRDEGYNGSGAWVTDRNQFEDVVKGLIDQGVKFLFCQNTTRGFIKNGVLPEGDATAELIPGVEYTTAGLTAISDYQARGYTYVQP
jgi:intracellular sulfur oxidation DsrE/DsrF family protein